ncbi:hypothetical protein ADK70_22620 [Streptomyces rimosus subsp. pseudoverticillatus]|nr:hypothetical protein ADK70_22620 [Streptomyces rimosus subsp. pseudoverticillatus]
MRAPALPFEVFESLTACGSVEQVRSRLRKLARDPRIVHALEVAGSDLVEGLRRLDEDPGATGRRTVRAYAGLFRYVTRMATRATPFGAFAGVALGEFGTATAARLGAVALGFERVRPDMGWLMHWVKQLEEDPSVLPELRLTANDTAYYAGERLVLPLTDVHGDVDRRSVSVRATPPVRLAMHAAKGIPYGKLIASVHQAFPQVPRGRVAGLVKQLHDLRLLTTDLRPPLGDPHPERWLLSRLEDLPGDGASQRAADLRRVVELTRWAGNGETGALHRAQQAMTGEYKRQTYQLDSALTVPSPRLPKWMAEEVAKAADCLVRLAAAEATDPLASYRAAFRERYSENALVPVLELLSPEQGLDAPPGYLHPPRAYPLEHREVPSDDAAASSRDRIRCELAARASRTGTAEIELTDELLDRLAPESDRAVREHRPVTALDVFVQIQAASTVDIDRGHWRAVLTGMAPGGGTCGRFADMLGEKAHHLLAQHAAQEEQQQPEAACAEVSYLPLAAFGGNVAISPRLHTYEIPVNTTPSLPADRVIALDDILVGATLKRMYLWSRRLNREIIVTQNHRLNHVNAPNICRFLLEVSRHKQVSPHGFPWGSMERAPYLPRVVRGRIVLSPARWRLTASLLADHGARPGAREFTRALGTWHRTWGVPRHVHLFEGPDPLLLDLEHHLCLEELKAAMRRQSEGLVLQEPPALPDQQWLRDDQDRPYICEVVVPLVNQRTAPAPGAGPRSFPRAALAAIGSTPRTRHLPGDTWTSLSLYAPAEQHDRIISGPLQELITTCEKQSLTDRWFFIRYADPRPHLRIRLRARTPDTAGRVLPATLEWGRLLIERGLADDLSLTGYAPEIERYGGAAAFDAVEQVFEASSCLTAELIGSVPTGDTPIDLDCLTVVALDSLYTHWGLSLDQRLALIPALANTDEQAEARAAFRTHRDYLCGLLTPVADDGPQQSRTDRQRLLPVLLAQQPAVAKAAAAVRAAVADDRLWGTESSILTSLAHMQVNRLRPIDHPTERRCYLLWRHTLRAIQGRRNAGPGNRRTA